MSAATESRAALVQRCRNLERRFIRLNQSTGHDCSIAIQWARQWTSALLDTKCPTAMYANWVNQQEARADRLEAQALRVAA